MAPVTSTPPPDNGGTGGFPDNGGGGGLNTGAATLGGGEGLGGGDGDGGTASSVVMSTLHTKAELARAILDRTGSAGMVREGVPVRVHARAACVHICVCVRVQDLPRGCLELDRRCSGRDG